MTTSKVPQVSNFWPQYCTMSMEGLDVTAERAFGRLAGPSDYQKILDVWQGKCLKSNISLPNDVVDKFRKRLADGGSNKVFASLDVSSGIGMDNEAVKLLVEVLAMRPIIVKLDISNTYLPNETLKLLLRLLRGQARLAKTIALDNRLQAGFLGEVLFDCSGDAEQWVIDEIRLISGALKLCNAHRLIRAQYLNLQIEEPVSYEALAQLWQDLFADADEAVTEGYLQDAFSFSALLYKMYDPLTYEEVEAVLLSGFIVQGYLDVPTSRQLEIVGYTSEWLVEKLQELESQPYVEEPVPVVELTLPDDDMFEPVEQRGADAGNLGAQTATPLTSSTAADDSELAYPSSAAPAKLVTASLFTAKYLKQAMQSSQRTPPPAPPPPPMFREYPSASAATSTKMDSQKSAMFIDYDKLRALQEAPVQMPPAVRAHPSTSPRAHDYLMTPTEDHPHDERRQHRPSHIDRRNSAPSPVLSETSDYRYDEEREHERAVGGRDNRFDQSFENRGSVGTVNQLSPQKSTPARHFYPVRTVSEVSDMGADGNYLASQAGHPDKFSRKSQLEVDVGPSSFLLDFTASASPAKLSVHTVCNASHTDGELADLLGAQSSTQQQDISVLILRNNDIYYAERLNLRWRFPHLTDLDLSYNNIAGAVKGLPPALVRLDLSHNRITNVSDVLNCLDLVELNLAHNNVKSFHGLPSKLQRVNLSHNCISSNNTLRALALSPNITSLELSGNAVLLESKDWRVLLTTLLPQLAELNGKPVVHMKKAAKDPLGTLSRTRSDPAISCSKSTRTQGTTRDDQRICDSVRQAPGTPQKEDVMQEAQAHYLNKVIKRSAILKPKQIAELTHRLTNPTSAYRHRGPFGQTGGSERNPSHSGSTRRSTSGRRLDNSRNPTEFYSRSRAPNFMGTGDRSEYPDGGLSGWSYDSRQDEMEAAHRWEIGYGETKAGIEAYPTGYAQFDDSYAYDDPEQLEQEQGQGTSALHSEPEEDVWPYSKLLPAPVPSSHVLSLRPPAERQYECDSSSAPATSVTTTALPSKQGSWDALPELNGEVQPKLPLPPLTDTPRSDAGAGSTNQLDIVTAERPDSIGTEPDDFRTHADVSVIPSSSIPRYPDDEPHPDYTKKDPPAAEVRTVTAPEAPSPTVAPLEFAPPLRQTGTTTMSGVAYATMEDAAQSRGSDTPVSTAEPSGNNTPTPGGAKLTAKERILARMASKAKP